MSELILLNDQTAVKRLAERLSQCPEVTKHDEGEEKEAGVLAHSFADLEESFRTFLNEYLPRLTTAAELCAVLFEIGEEFRHILYHIHNSKFYRYLHPDGADMSS